MERKYGSDLTDSQWESIKRLLPKASKRGRKSLDRRLILDAILYLLRTGCQWRQLPNDFPNWKSVYTVFWRWRKNGTWQRIHDKLREKLRKKLGRKAKPSAAIIDSQSVKTTEVGGDKRGFDAAKKIKGRKRHIAVDTLGLILAVVVQAANIQDQVGAKPVLELLAAGFGRLQVVFADAAYGRSGLPKWTKRCCKFILQTVLRPAEAKGFVHLPKRWIVERTFGWLGRWRRHSKDYESNPETSEAMIHLTMIYNMSRRLEASD